MKRESNSIIYEKRSRKLLSKPARLVIALVSVGVGVICGLQRSTWEKYNDAGQAAYKQGHYAEAEKAWSSALQEAEKSGPETRHLGRSLDHLASLYYDQGKYAQSEPLYKRTLDFDEKKFGPNSSQVAADFTNLALVYGHQGKYALAEPLNKAALAIREKIGGPNDLDVAESLNNLAKLYYSQGKYAEAEPLYKRVLDIDEKLHSKYRTDVAMHLENYAALLRKTNRQAEAAQLEARAKAVRAGQT